MRIVFEQKFTSAAHARKKACTPKAQSISPVVEVATYTYHKIGKGKKTKHLTKLVR
jgi:hypothetical protein